MRAGDLGRAIGLALRALDSGYADPVLFNLRAHWRKHNGRPTDALADLERALELDPRSPPILTGIADCLNTLGHHKKALAAADGALVLEPALAAAWYQKALAHQMLNDIDAAKAAYLEAVRHDPGMADALSRLAALCAQQGDSANARTYADRALVLRPGHDVAHLAHIALDLAEGRQEAAEARIQSLLANRQVAPLTRAIALSHLGDLRDRQRRADEAFAAYREAGHVWTSVYGTRFARPDQESVPQMLDRLTAAFS
ncbi:MAG TPA: tetratricopeptide repeat protein [Rhizomicrobium sp.]|jgi:tetratricopeptide (TPR) repeat protein